MSLAFCRPSETVLEGADLSRIQSTRTVCKSKSSCECCEKVAQARRPGGFAPIGSCWGQLSAINFHPVMVAQPIRREANCASRRSTLKLPTSGLPAPCRLSTVMCGVPSGRAGSTQPSSFPRLAAVQTLQREQDLTSLAPKGRLIAAQPVEGIGRQVGQADKGACEVVRWISRFYGR